MPFASMIPPLRCCLMSHGPTGAIAIHLSDQNCSTESRVQVPRTLVRVLLIPIVAMLLCVAAEAETAPPARPETPPRSSKIPDLGDKAVLEFNAGALSNQTTGDASILAAPDWLSEPGQPLLLASTTSAKGFAVIHTAHIRIEPRRQYRVQALLKLLGSAPDSSVSLWVREYADPNRRPITPYPRTGVKDRSVQAHQRNIWTIRSLTFRTRPEARYLTISINTAGAPTELLVKSVRIVDVEKRKDEDAREMKDVLMQLQREASSRKPLVDRTLVFSRAQMKYGLERNYMRKWIDRPLLVDRALRVPRKYVTPYPSYVRMMDVVEQYGLDGLAFFPETKDRMGMFELTERAAPREFVLLPEFIPNGNIEAKAEVLKNALKCRNTVRIKGKILVTSYVASALKPSEWKKVLSSLRDRYGDCFIFLPALTKPVRFKSDFQEGIAIAREEVDECKAFLRSYLDVCDGLYFNYAAALKRKNRTFDREFYRELLIPIYKSVLSEARYRHKFLGLSAYHSHYNADLSLGLQEDGTKTLRNSFEAAMDARPDVIVLPEWDEVNENTCFRPTVYNSFTTQRILRYYMSRLRGKALAPAPGDDTSLPDLIVSYRKLLTLGEKLEVELLNVPDSLKKHSYRVQLQLFDHAGNLVRKLDPLVFHTGRLQAQTCTVPSEELAAYPSLIPVLNIEGYKDQQAIIIDRGLHHIQVRATWNWDYKFVKQPIRDLIRPNRASFTFGQLPALGALGGDGRALVAGTFECNEKIALVEVLEDDDVVYAVDPDNEFFRDSRDQLLLWIEFRSLRKQDLSGTLTMHGATCDWRFNNLHLHQPPPTLNVQEDKVEIRTPVSSHLRWVYVALPKKNAEAARLEFDFNLFKTVIPVKQIIENGIYSETHPDGLTMTVGEYWKQPDMPRHLDRSRVSFTARVKPELPTSQFHMRVTSKSGKTYRSVPLLLPEAMGGPSVDLRAYSDSKQHPVNVQVREVRIPDCSYDFTPKYGSILHTDAGRPFWGQLGGYVDSSSGRGGNGGGVSATLFRFGTYQYPVDAHRTAPTRKMRDGHPCLEFDGIGNYFLLPREALPRHGPFTLTFEIFPSTDKKPQYLFMHRSLRASSLMLFMQAGKLGGSFSAQGGKHYSFKSDLQIAADRWSKVSAVYDFTSMRLRVNDKEQSFPCSGPGLNIGPCGFGGYGKGGKNHDAPGNAWWFSGYLKSLRIIHNVTDGPPR